MFQKLFRKIKSKSLMYFDNRTFRVLNSLPNSGQLTFVDIGAAGEIQPRWKPFSRKLNYIGFEPDERSISNIQNKSNNFLSYRILPHAISDKRGDIEFNYMPGYPPTINSKDESIFAANVAKELVGTKNVITEVEPSMGGEDFAYFLNNKPGSYLYIGQKDKDHNANLHTTNYDFNDNLLPIGVNFWVDLVKSFFAK